MAGSSPHYDAVVFDLLTALLNSWKLWNDVAGSEEAGMRWRARYLEITYGCGPYRPYPVLVEEAATAAGYPASLATALVGRWQELEPWPEVPAVRPGSASAFRSALPPTARSISVGRRRTAPVARSER
jgi:2-haloacid dehalogenase